MTLARRNFERNRRLIAAIVIATLFHVEHLSPLAALKALRGIIRALLPHKHVDRWIYFRRLRHCYRCELFYRPLRTCGSPLVDELGCGCEMEFKSSLKNARCWLNESTDLTTGWPKELEL